MDLLPKKRSRGRERTAHTLRTKSDLLTALKLSFSCYKSSVRKVLLGQGTMVGICEVGDEPSDSVTT